MRWRGRNFAAGRESDGIMNTPNEIVLFESKDGKVSLSVSTDGQTIWLSKAQMAQLFEKDRSVISRHIRHAIQEGEIDSNIMCAKFAHMGRTGIRFTTWRNVNDYI